MVCDDGDEGVKCPVQGGSTDILLVVVRSVLGKSLPHLDTRVDLRPCVTSGKVGILRPRRYL